MSEKKYSSCSKCLETMLDIQLGQSDKHWVDLGNGETQCKGCLEALQKQFYTQPESVQAPTAEDPAVFYCEKSCA